MPTIKEHLLRLEGKLESIDQRLSNDLAHLKGKTDIQFWILGAMFLGILAIIIQKALG